MLNILRIAVFIFISLFAQKAEVKEIPQIKVWAEESKPLSYRKNDAITGFTTELVKELIQQTGLLVSQWTLAPWPRAYFEAKSTPNSLLYTVVRNSDREDFFHWIGPIGPRSIFLVKLSSRDDIRTDTFDQRSDLTVGVMRKSIAEKILYSRKMKTVGVTTELSQFRMFMQGRTDLIAISDYSLYFNAKEAGLSLDKFKVVEVLDESMDYYIALNRETDRQIVAALQSAFLKVATSGKLMDIRIKWFGKLTKLVQDYK